MQGNSYRPRTNHGSLLYDGVVSLLQIAVQDVTKHTGGILMQVACSFSHTVVLAPDRDVDALFLLTHNKVEKCTSQNNLTQPDVSDTFEMFQTEKLLQINC